jgi:DNA-binding GntR family transcriptional regulator
MIGGSTQYPLTRSSRSATSGRRDLLKAIAERNPTSGENKETPSPPACSNSGQVNRGMESITVLPPVSVSLQAVTKAEAVYIETRSRILKGTLAPGLAVNQEALAADLGVSITPLREALRRLEMEGLIRLEAHRTMIITPLTSKELEETYAIRTELDPFAAGLAASNVSTAQLEVIYRLARQKAVSDPVLQLERNRGFHRAVYSSCGNHALINLLEQLWDRTDRYRLILIREELLRRSTWQQDHIDLADALAGRKADLAARLMRAHIKRSLARIVRVMTARAADRGIAGD